MEVKKELKTMNTAIKGIQKMVKELIKTTDRAYA